MRAVTDGKGQQSDAREEEAVEHHVAHTHVGQHDLSEVKACAPEATSQRARTIAEPVCGAVWVRKGCRHSTTVRVEARLLRNSPTQTVSQQTANWFHRANRSSTSVFGTSFSRVDLRASSVTQAIHQQ